HVHVEGCIQGTSPPMGGARLPVLVFLLGAIVPGTRRVFLKTRLLTVLLMPLLWAAPAAAQKADIIVMINGDRNTGEIKSYDEGRLLLSTSNQGDIKIEWAKIVSITSDKTFDLELTDGTHIFGTLQPSDPPGKLQVVLPE